MRHRRQGGSVIVLIAISTLLLVAFVGLVVDGGEVTAQGRASQNAADSGALAASYELINGDTVAQAAALAQAVATKNGIPTNDLTLTFLDSGNAVLATCNPGCSAAPAPSSVTKVKADVSHNFPTLFLPIINIDTAVVSSHAAVAVTPGGGGCAICIMNPGASGALAAGASSNLTASGGGIVVNSTSASAVTGPVQAPSITVVGGWTGCTCNPTPTHGGPFADPLALVAPPVIAGPAQGAFAGSGTIQPGIYTSIVPTGNTTMAPGNYVVTGAMTIAGSRNFTANNVFIYFGCSSYPTACNSGQAGGFINLTSSGNISMSPPAYGAWNGMLLFSDRNNVAANNLAGTANMSVQGTVYSLSARLSLNGDGLVNNVGGTRVVVDSLVLSGGAMSLSYVPSQNFVGPGKLTLVT